MAFNDINVNQTHGDAADTNPPTYQQATEPPPSYQSLFGEIREVRKESSNAVEFLMKLIVLLASTVGVVIFLGILLAIPIAMIVLGAKYKDDCPREDKIPIYLIVMGAVLIVRNLSNICSKITSDNEGEGEDDDKSAPHKCCDSILDLFIFCWFITGNFWIYHIYEPSYKESDGGDYCNKTLYLFSFWITTASYIFIGFLCCCACSIGVCYMALGDDED